MIIEFTAEYGGSRRPDYRNKNIFGLREKLEFERVNI
jgi:hypothetical protein